MLAYWKAYWRLYFALRFSLLENTFDLWAILDFLENPYHRHEALSEVCRLARSNQAYQIGGYHAS